MKREEKISIVIPVYNRQELIKGTLDSVLAQTFSNWECIVVDDGSTDNTWLVLEEYANKDSRIKIHKRKREPKGAPTCRNIGIEKSSANYLIFLDSDDLLLSFCLEKRAEIFTQKKDFDFVLFPVLQMKNGKNEYLSIINDKNPLDRFLTFQIAWITSSPLWSKQFLKSIKGWKEGVLVGQDFEIHIRALLNTNSFYWASDIPDVIQRPHLPGSSKSITTTHNIEKLINQTQTHVSTYSQLPNELKEKFNKTYMTYILKLIESHSKSDGELLLETKNTGIAEILSQNQLKKVKFYLTLHHFFNGIPVLRGAFYRIRRFNFPFPKRTIFFNIRPIVPDEIMEVIQSDKIYIDFKQKHIIP